MRFVGERKAVAAAVMAFFSVLFFMNSLMGPPEFSPMFFGLLGVYLVGFFGVVAGWFWARWFAMGVGFSGLVIAAILAWQVGWDPIVLIFGGTHLAIVASLAGAPAKQFEGRTDWRERWKMDDNAVNRLGRAVTRAGASLPYLVMAGLAPRGAMAGEWLGLSAPIAMLAGLVLVVFGLRALVKMRTWGVLALAAGGVVCVFAGFELASVSMAHIDHAANLSTHRTFVTMQRLLFAGSLGVIGGLLAVWAAAPFVRPLLRALRA